MIKIKNIENATDEDLNHLENVQKALTGVLASKVFFDEFMKLDFEVLMDEEVTYIPNENLWQATQGNLHIDKLRFFYDVDSTKSGGANERLNQISINTKYFEPNKLDSNAATLIHEYLHLVGFDHSGSQDWQSVPYQVGDLVLKILRKYPYISGAIELKRVSRSFPLCLLKTYKWK